MQDTRSRGDSRRKGLGWDVFFVLYLVSCIVSLAPAFAASRTVLDDLRRFFSETNTFSARFDQVVLDDAHQPVQHSSGMLWIERPNKFRWDYDKPYQQQIVADGKRLWIYDVGLEQVTVRPLSGGLGDTPAMLLAGRGRLEDNFTIKPLEPRDNLEWAQLTPRRKAGGYEDIRVGFDQGRLQVLEMADGFGNTTRLTFHAVRENPKIDAARFSFTPPAGVDVVGE
jgi:outer membrane lipoprotein carrier protein